MYKTELDWVSAYKKLEQENEELKKACDETQELLDKQIEATLKLDKENAELKARLNAINLLTPELEKMSKLRKQQLTKAKELLSWWVNHCGNHDLFYAEKTEKFLKELEK